MIGFYIKLFIGGLLLNTPVWPLGILLWLFLIPDALVLLYAYRDTQHQYKNSKNN